MTLNKSGPWLFVLLLLLPGSQFNTSSARELDWSWGPVFPVAQSAETSVVVGQSIVVVGGTTWHEKPDGSSSKTYSDKVWKLEAKGTQWQTLRDFPLPLAFAQAVANESILWVVGGANRDGLLDNTFKIDLSQENPVWQPGPPLPTPRMGSQGGMVDRVIYVASGTESRDGHEQPATNILCLDTTDADATWQTVTEIPEPTAEWRMGTVSGRKLYLFGGLTNAKPVSGDSEPRERVFYRAAPFIPQTHALAYDIDSRKWERLPPSPIAVGSGGCTPVDQSHIFLSGGLALAVKGDALTNHKNRLYLSSECFLYDIKQKEYEIIAPPMRLAVLDQGCVCLGNSLFIIGGEDSPWKSRTDLVQVGKLQ